MKKINARNKGHSYERAIRKEMLEWFPDCQTSRYQSRYVDDVLKVDLCGTGFLNVQLKAVERGLNYHNTLAEMPEDDQAFNIIIHKKNRLKELVVMEKKDFYAILDYFKLFKLI